MLSAGWQPKDFSSAATRVEFENTNFLGSGKTYARFMVPGGGLMYAGYDLNHSYHGHGRLCFAGQAEGAPHGWRYAVDEELFRHHAVHHLQPRGARGRTEHHSDGIP